jgi:lantibiotic modifying enzyme
MSGQDMRVQLWIIRASMVALSGEGSPVQPCLLPVRSESNLGEIVTAVAEVLVERSTQSDNLATWHTYNASSRAIELLCDNLYDGLSGMALFFAYAGATISPRYSEIALRCIHTIKQRGFGQVGNSCPPIGGFNGIGGMIYACAHVGSVTGTAWPITLANDLAVRARAQIVHDSALDLVGGTAGLVMGLLSLHAACPESNALNIAVEGGEHLSRQAVRRMEGVTWPSLSSERGFSHGIAGIASSLAALADASQQRRFLELACAAVAHERSLVKGGQYTDPTGAANVGQATWCHGAPGLALSRLSIANLHHDKALLEELNEYTCVTAGAIHQPNDSLCHGTLGNLDVLSTLASAGGMPWASETANTELRGAVARILETGWQPPARNGIDNPGLMTGLSGLGFCLLRALNPTIPSVLMLSAPVPPLDRKANDVLGQRVSGA